MCEFRGISDESCVHLRSIATLTGTKSSLDYKSERRAVGATPRPLSVARAQLDSAQKAPYDLGLPLPGPADTIEPRRGTPNTSAFDRTKEVHVRMSTFMASAE